MRTIDINTQCNTAVTLGIRGENEVTEVRFDYSDWLSEFGNGVVMLLVKRSEDASPYPVALTYDGNVAVWTVTETDTAYNGKGQAEWLYYIGEQLAKSLVVKTYVVKDIGVELTPPDPYETWLDTLTELAAQTQTNAETAVEAKDDAVSAKESAETAEGNAEQSAQSAQESAESAQASATQASGSAQTASTKASEASQSASSASASATSASGSASSASSSASSASASATQANGYANTAKSYKEQADGILEQCQSILNQIIAMDIPDIYVVDNKLVVKERSTNG